MKLKFIQSVATADFNYQPNEIYKINNKKQAEDFVKAGFAEVVDDEKPTKETAKQVEEVAEKPKTTRRRTVKASE